MDKLIDHTKAKELQKLIEENSRIVLTCHVRPDGDAIGSTLGLWHLLKTFGKEVAVVGGGNSALQEAVLLSDGCKKVTLIQNLDVFTGEERLLNILRARDNVEMITGTVVSGFGAENGELTAVHLAPTGGGEPSTREVDGLFVAIGLVPDNKAFADVATLDDAGYFAAGEDCTTATPGVFIAGDCRAKRIRQITTATADGAVAALAACAYVDAQGDI